MKFWIARDPDGSLWRFDDKPILLKYGWGVKRKTDSETKPAKRLHEWHFQEITFENSPQLVEIKLVKEE